MGGFVRLYPTFHIVFAALHAIAGSFFLKSWLTCRQSTSFFTVFLLLLRSANTVASLLFDEVSLGSSCLFGWSNCCLVMLAFSRPIVSWSAPHVGRFINACTAVASATTGFLFALIALYEEDAEIIQNLQLVGGLLMGIVYLSLAAAYHVFAPSLTPSVGSPGRRPIMEDDITCEYVTASLVVEGFVTLLAALSPTIFTVFFIPVQGVYLVFELIAGYGALDCARTWGDLTATAARESRTTSFSDAVVAEPLAWQSVPERFHPSLCLGVALPPPTRAA
eukprot:Rmarinus@m.26038